MFVPDKPFQLRVMFEPTQKISGAPLLGRLIALPTNISLDWEGLQGTSTLAYYDNSQVKDKKFDNIGPGVNVKNFLRPSLRLFVIRYNIYPCQAFPAKSNV